MLVVASSLFVASGFAKSFIAVAPTAPAVVKPAVEAPAKLNANAIMVPVGKTGKTISLKELSTISKSDLELLRGKKMGFFEKIAFNKAQKQLKKGMDENGTITSKKLNKVLTSKKAGETGFHLGGFALGFFVGLIGVLIAYVAFDDDFKKNRIKWSWIGFAAFAVLWIVLVVAVFASAASSI